MSAAKVNVVIRIRYLKHQGVQEIIAGFDGEIGLKTGNDFLPVHGKTPRLQLQTKAPTLKKVSYTHIALAMKYHLKAPDNIDAL